MEETNDLPARPATRGPSPEDHNDASGRIESQGECTDSGSSRWTEVPAWHAAARLVHATVDPAEEVEAKSLDTRFDPTHRQDVLRLNFGVIREAMTANKA